MSTAPADRRVSTVATIRAYTMENALTLLVATTANHPRPRPQPLVRAAAGDLLVRRVGGPVLRAIDSPLLGFLQTVALASDLDDLRPVDRAVDEGDDAGGVAAFLIAEPLLGLEENRSSELGICAFGSRVPTRCQQHAHTDRDGVSSIRIDTIRLFVISRSSVQVRFSPLSTCVIETARVPTDRRLVVSWSCFPEGIDSLLCGVRPLVSSRHHW